MLTIPNSTIRLLAALAVTLSLAACATQGSRNTDHGAHHPGQTVPSTEAAAPRAGAGGTMGARSGVGMMGSGTMGGQSVGGMMGAGAGGQSGPGAMNMNAMCAMYREMQSAPIAERRAMLDQQMKGMAPEMRQQHMEMMRQQCK